MRIYKLAQMLMFVCLASSCQKNSNIDLVAGNLDSSSLGITSCQPGSSGLSVSDAKILGTENIVSDQKVTLGLDSSVNCDQAQKAVWSTGNTLLGQGSQVQATFSGTGIYYIHVRSTTEPSLNETKVNSKAVTAAISVLPTNANAVQVAVTDSKVMLIGSQVGVELNSYSFSLVVPAGTILKSANWNFGGGSEILHSLTSVSRSFSPGVHSFSVEVIDNNDKSTILQHTITVLPLGSGIDCSAEELATLEIAGPTQVPMSEIMSYSLNQPSCIKHTISKISWNFGDSTATASTSDVEHTYLSSGDYTISVGVWLNSSATPNFTLTRDINVVDMLEQFPGPSPGVPSDPNSCLVAGSQRTVEGSLINKDVACGTNGTRSDSYREQIIQVCQMNGTTLSWIEQSRSQVLVSAGQCLNQSCDVDTSLGQQNIANGQSVTLYTTSTPGDSCLAVKEIRTCNNGVMSGSSSARMTTCQSGCQDFGISGTVKVGVITGEIQTPVICPFQEQGISNVYNQISDKSCVDGTIITSNVRTGDLKTTGLCPVYNWVPTDSFTSCSADCGGKQTRIYACRDNYGVAVDNIRCGSANAAPVEERICDGNPQAVRQTISTSEVEEANSSILCPKNQIGIIVNERAVTTNVKLACIDHKVQEESRAKAEAPWVSTSYCRDFVPMRCSQDSLNNTEAAGRYHWMVKCQDQVPVIKEFLRNFEDVVYKGISLEVSTRHLYPTFLNSATKKAWIAPKVATASCDVPATVYIAAVCVSSCATPEQEILAQVESDNGLKNVTFIDALTQKLAKVGTLGSNSSIRSLKLEKTEVDNWVTELLDTTQTVLTFKMKSGGQLRVTPNHPLLTTEGSMKSASEFKENENLVQLGGHTDQIVSIQSSDYYGKVYNLFVKSNDLKKNVVVINGYLSGTAFYQNEGAQNMNRDLFRRNLIRGVFDK